MTCDQQGLPDLNCPIRLSGLVAPNSSLGVNSEFILPCMAAEQMYLGVARPTPHVPINPAKSGPDLHSRKWGWRDSVHGHSVIRDRLPRFDVGPGGYRHMQAPRHSNVV